MRIGSAICCDSDRPNVVQLKMEKTQAIDSRMAEWQDRADRPKNYKKINLFSTGFQGHSHDHGSPQDDDTSTEKTRGISSRVAAWQEKVEHPQKYQKSNPSSVSFHGSSYQNLGSHEYDANYGRPIQGSKTEFRGKAAGVHVSSEIVELCGVIQDMGTPLEDGSIAVRFGELFELYTRISNKVVGMLMRARKQGLVDFKGEMLYQRRDDHVLIRLIRTPEDLMNSIEQQKAELKHHPASKH